MATSRNRSRSSGPQTIENRREVNGVVTDTMDTNVKSSTETMSDVEIPDFHRRSADGEVFVNPCTYVKDTFNSTGGGVFDVTQYGTHYYAGGGGSNTTFMDALLDKYGASNYRLPYPDEPTEPLQMVEASKAQAWGNVDRTPYAFAEDLGEIRETLKFLKDPFVSLKDLARTFEKDVNLLYKRKKTLSRLQAIANIWLQYRFAATPLVRSLHDFFESLHDKRIAPKRRTARGKSEWRGIATAAKDAPYAWWANTEKHLHIRSGILYEDASPFEGWRDKYGLRFKDIPETLWALTPYSFVVDRMFNISQGLRGMASFLDPNIKILGAWVTTKKTVTRTRSFHDYVGVPGVTSKTILPDVDTWEVFTYDRQGWTPTGSDIYPVMDVGGLVDSSTKLADMGALILQRLK